MKTETVLYLVSPGPRPAYYEIANHLWGPGANIDSDGNSETPEDTTWTELTVAPRSGNKDQIVHIDPVSESPLVLKIRSPSALLVKKTMEFLSGFTGGVAHPTMPNN